ncbi:MurR/RpiR family transcriptional regulator [Tritonibacter mobilis]|jgi:DNA-binding MurR/RpiR family transcriptional regulator|uniref:MurR/RpiR family transcriptional regulator n=1 Tax=Tritonibacter mobilis TaxID=379347 RepID=UPI000E0D5942|nr:MurR/RpiR family transcriptional regulator [Tritonibacter mobilis]MCA2006538.1 MurR/RpiR family transcriptional regulator [Tritonibacter mobilis]NKX75547.1 MurR/RpiR family transcriptional regulator [Rhodobacteraceae bacterium R_SAG3]
MPTPDNGPAQGAVDLISNLRQLNGTFAAREQKVADFVSAHLEEISGMTIAELAGAVGVSTPTVVRFCRSMGCDGFREFKLRLAQNLAVSLQYLAPSHRDVSEGGAGAVDQVLGALYATVNVMRQQIVPERMDAAVQALTEAGQIVVAGVGGGSTMVAQEAANRMFRLGIPAVAVSDSYLLQMRAATLGANDVLLLVSTSGAADEIVSAAGIAGGYGATVVAITRPGSRLAQEATIAIEADLPEDPDILKPTASRYAHLVIVDALAMSVAQARSEATTENLRRIRASLTAYHGRTGPQPLGD